MVESGYFNNEDNTTLGKMSANDYFNYCKIAYIAGKRKGDQFDSSLSGKEMYKSYSDGRHNGLLDIDDNSNQEFANWIDGTHPKRTAGGHPWKIKPGGNTTHIDLAVFRPVHGKKETFKIELCGESTSRLKETVSMFLAIQKAKLPISIHNPEGIRKRILGLDNIGIVPNYQSLYRVNQCFPKEQDVYDVVYYDDITRYKQRLQPFIAWQPLPVFKPKLL